jgi:RNA polymerase sigma factor (sigma-70 family)
MTPILGQRARAVDRTFERLYRRHVGDVYRYSLAVLHNQADAEDVTQTTFMNAYRALERGEQPRTPHNWLIAIAHNVCRQRFRQAARRPAEVEWDDDIADKLVEENAPVSGEDVRRALAHLAFNQRAALVMRELEGRSYAEIAEVLGLSVSAVETLIFRARRALREQLEGALTCGEAELAISKQIDGRLSRREKGQLRAHLRECAECATFARRQRAARTALKSLGAVPLPASLVSVFGGGGAGGTAVAGAVAAAKVAAVVAATAAVGGGSYEAVHHAVHKPQHATQKPTVVAPARSVSPPAVHVRVAPSAAPRVNNTHSAKTGVDHGRHAGRQNHPAVAAHLAQKRADHAAKQVAHAAAKAQKQAAKQERHAVHQALKTQRVPGAANGKALGHAKAAKPENHGRKFSGRPASHR